MNLIRLCPYCRSEVEREDVAKMGITDEIYGCTNMSCLKVMQIRNGQLTESLTRKNEKLYCDFMEKENAHLVQRFTKEEFEALRDGKTTFGMSKKEVRECVAYYTTIYGNNFQLKVVK